MLVCFKDAVAEAYSRTVSAGHKHDISQSDLEHLTNYLISEFIDRTNFYKEIHNGQPVYVNDLLTVPMSDLVYETFDGADHYTSIGKIILLLHLKKNNNDSQFLVTYAENLKYCWSKKVMQLLADQAIDIDTHAHFKLKKTVGHESQLYVFYVQSHRRESKWYQNS